MEPGAEGGRPGQHRHPAWSPDLKRVAYALWDGTNNEKVWVHDLATSDVDRRLVNLTLTASGAAMMQELYPAFNAAEADVVSCLSTRALTDLTRSLRLMVASLEETSLERTDSRRHIEPARGA